MTKNVDEQEGAPIKRNDQAGEPIGPAHRVRVEAGLADVREGRLATQVEVEEAFFTFRRGP